jgi:DNA-binding transcriptional ArsR family regulator
MPDDPPSTPRPSAVFGNHAVTMQRPMEPAATRDPFDALGDPNRRAIVALLREGDRSVGALARDLPISRPAVSRHLRLLKEAGLVTDRAEGTRRLYRLHGEGIEAVRAYVEQIWGDAASRFTIAAENTSADRARR